MSNAFSSSFDLQASSSAVDQANNVSPTFNLNAAHNFGSSPGPPVAGPSTLAYSNRYQSTPGPAPSKTSSNLSERTAEEQIIINQTSAKFTARLALDHAAVLYPDADTPFIDTVDLVNRLLPYHVYQQPKEDLDRLTMSGKGKGKATEDQLAEEIAETKFALECFKRRRALQARLYKLKLKSGKRSAPDDQAYVLAQTVLDTERTETTLLNNELRSARAELERREKEKRAATNSARIVYHGSASPATVASAQYYRGYPYAYTQIYGAPVQSSSTSTFSVANYAPTQSAGAIPVQLPVASLPALHALGIIPVPAASLPPDGHQQPPAVLRGSTSNGTMLSLEINVSLLQSAQMSGLAMVLNSLMSRSSGTPAGYTGDPQSTLSPVPNGNNITAS